MIVAVRHAAVWNPEGVVYARLPDFHLSPEGREDAERLAGALAGVPVAAVHSSPLERAVETAEILARPHGLEVTLDERLLEWSFWIRWQGMSWSRIRERDPDLLDSYALDPETASPDDPLRAAGERLLAWAAEAEETARVGARGGDTVIGVTHEAPLVAALITGRGEDISTYHRYNLPHLGAVRLRPSPPEVLDLVAWASSR